LINSNISRRFGASGGMIIIWFSLCLRVQFWTERDLLLESRLVNSVQPHMEPNYSLLPILCCP
jgi:hypothetical protein